jgi:hypothetical protein
MLSQLRRRLAVGQALDPTRTTERVWRLGDAHVIQNQSWCTHSEVDAAAGPAIRFQFSTGGAAAASEADWHILAWDLTDNAGTPITYDDLVSNSLESMELGVVAPVFSMDATEKVRFGLGLTKSQHTGAPSTFAHISDADAEILLVGSELDNQAAGYINGTGGGTSVGSSLGSFGQWLQSELTLQRLASISGGNRCVGVTTTALTARNLSTGDHKSQWGAASSRRWLKSSGDRVFLTLAIVPIGATNGSTTLTVYPTTDIRLGPVYGRGLV